MNNLFEEFINNNEYFKINNRRYLGNKFKLLKAIHLFIQKNSINFNSFFDPFSGTGSVADFFNTKDNVIIANDLLFSNYLCLKCFLGTKNIKTDQISNYLKLLNNKTNLGENYFSKHYSNTFFSKKNAKKIGNIREIIEKMQINKNEKNILITSLLYSMDKVANTVGHYDAYRKKLDQLNELILRMPLIHTQKNKKNKVFNKDANNLSKKIIADLTYIDPPYNSRQYSDTYHLLENVAEWKKPLVHGKVKKMNRDHIKSQYCLKNAPDVFEDLIQSLQTKHIIVSYNNTENSKHGRSNAKITFDQIKNILEKKGKTKVEKINFKAFTTGKSNTQDHKEILFYCKVR